MSTTDALSEAPDRRATSQRATKETTVEAALRVDGTGVVEVHTGLPFFDHMVEQLGRHASFDLVLHARGDLEVDAHHTVEDVGIVLGGCLAEALGDLPVESWPSEANFILFRPLGQSGDKVWHGLLDRSVLIRNCSTWDGLEGCLRVTIGRPDENDRFLTALKELL